MFNHQQDEDPYPYIRQCEGDGCAVEVTVNLLFAQQLCTECIVAAFRRQLDALPSTFCPGP